LEFLPYDRNDFRPWFAGGVAAWPFFPEYHPAIPQSGIPYDSTVWLAGVSARPVVPALDLTLGGSSQLSRLRPKLSVAPRAAAVGTRRFDGLF
jgi:hypothetical protein